MDQASGDPPFPSVADPESVRTVQVGVLELREELPVIVRESVLAGQVNVRREVRTRTETVVMELTRETLHIEVIAGQAAVYLGDELLQAGENREVVLYDEQVVVSKQAYITQEVRVSKRTVTERSEYPLELQREELVVDRTDPTGRIIPGE